MIEGTLTTIDGTYDIHLTGTMPCLWVAMPQGLDRKERRRFIRKSKKAAVRRMRIARNQGGTPT